MAKIAVVGSGISGLACAHLLQADHSVTVFEAADQPGGHARTLFVPDLDGGTTVDTGFIVYNEINYPLFTRLLSHLDIPTQPTNMTFGVRYGNGELEFSASSLKGLFAQKKNLYSPSFWRMLADILFFFRSAKSVLDNPGDPTLGQLLDDLRLGEWCRNRFITPMGAAIWSTPPAEMLNFPAKAFVRFFQNHNLLSISKHHPWRTIVGGSEVYVGQLIRTLRTPPRLNTPIVSVAQTADQTFSVTDRGREPEEFDEVVFACPADTALNILTDATPAERAILRPFKFRENTAVLHTDTSLMPANRNAWASWIYAASGPETNNRVSVTYWMNQLQNLPCRPLFVTLNPDRQINPDCILDEHVFRHPTFDQAALVAQTRLHEIQGQRGVWFCGAWQRHGFHEDGLWSAVRIAEAKKASLPW